MCGWEWVKCKIRMSMICCYQQGGMLLDLLLCEFGYLLEEWVCWLRVRFLYYLDLEYWYLGEVVCVEVDF